MKIALFKKNNFSIYRHRSSEFIGSSMRDWRAVVIFCAVLMIGFAILGFFAFLEASEKGDVVVNSPSNTYKFLEIKGFEKATESFSARALDLASGRANRIEIVDPSR